MKHAKGLVIRTAFNNAGWAGRCNRPLTDPRCFKCVKGGLFINHRKPVSQGADGQCKGDILDRYPLQDMGEEGLWCWEQVLCRKYFWGNVKGRWSSVFRAMPVYFVYATSNNTLTLWGFSTIADIHNEPSLDYPYIEFEPFSPLPEADWVKGLTGERITGESWRQLNFRYLDDMHQKYLASLIEGGSREITVAPTRHDNISVQLRRDIREKLEDIAETEGRQVNDLIREAIAKLIRERS